MEIVVIILALMAYFLPAAIATSRGHANGTAIFFLNFFLGWTLIGWIAALIWSLTANLVKSPAPASARPDTHVKCPDCAELIKREAKICKHCGCRLVPQ